MAAGVFTVRIRRAGGPEARLEVPDGEGVLQRLMDRANAEFGDPARELGGPSPVVNRPSAEEKGRARRPR